VLEQHEEPRGCNDHVIVLRDVDDSPSHHHNSEEHNDRRGDDVDDGSRLPARDASTAISCDRRSEPTDDIPTAACGAFRESVRMFAGRRS
jgi:hypothetical protein